MKITSCQNCKCKLHIIPASRQKVSFKDKAICFNCWEGFLYGKTAKKVSNKKSNPKKKTKPPKKRNRNAQDAVD